MMLKEMRWWSESGNSSAESSGTEQFCIRTKSREHRWPWVEEGDPEGNEEEAVRVESVIK